MDISNNDDRLCYDCTKIAKNAGDVNYNDLEPVICDLERLAIMTIDAMVGSTDQKENFARALTLQSVIEEKAKHLKQLYYKAHENGHKHQEAA